MTYKKKLIEVAIPLEAINAASAREKSIRHGHPSTLHLWWARRPLAACRAVLFAQLVDDPSSRVEELMADAALVAKAEKVLPDRRAAWEKSKASAKGAAASALEPTLEDVVVDIERKRLFAIIEELVLWENSTNEEVLERARAEIRKSCGGELPPVYDPFSGGGSIPLEAQRLGLPAYGSDLNPVAVMIGKAMIEIPPKFKDMPPIHPGPRERQFYRNAEGLAEDVKYYGEWMRQKAGERIGHLYPQVDLPKEYGGGKATVIAWIWSRTVPSPDPAFAGSHVPIASSFMLSAKSGNEVWVEPIVDRQANSVKFSVRRGGTKAEIVKASEGAKAGRGNFTCLLSGAGISTEYIRKQGQAGNIGFTLMAIVAEGKRGRFYVDPSVEQVSSAGALQYADEIDQFRTRFLSGSTPEKLTGGTSYAYGLTTWGSLFTDRQIAALMAFCDLLPKVRTKIAAEAEGKLNRVDQSSLSDGGGGSKAYAEAVSVYLAFAINRVAMSGNSLVRWNPVGQKAQHIFSRQAIAMLWDFAETNPLGNATGAFNAAYVMAENGLYTMMGEAGGVRQFDAQTVKIPQGSVLNTDPPYYDNIAYADLSDFFYCWLRPALKDVYPEIFGVLATPKSEELVATRYRHGSRESAEEFFLAGMRRALTNAQAQTTNEFPAAIYYAFKQSEMSQDGVTSAGWATFLQATIDAGFAVVGTWPVRTEMRTRQVAMGTNALANSVVLVCRKREATAETVTRAEFIRALKRELPSAIAELQAANIAPADMPQSAIGPGMGVFSRFKAVLEADDSPMSVKTALQLINAELDAYLGGIQGEFDADTRFAITWFEQHGMAAGEYGAADNLARARGISVDSVRHAGIVESAAGRVRLFKRDELDAEWEPGEDSHLTIWECLQHLIRLHEKDGLSWETIRMMRMIGPQAEAAKDLAYCLYDISANKRKDAKEATAYNAIIADWTEMSRQAAKIHDMRRDGQAAFDL
jgi:putative DNA methylase